MHQPPPANNKPDFRGFVLIFWVFYAVGPVGIDSASVITVIHIRENVK